MTNISDFRIRSSARAVTLLILVFLCGCDSDPRHSDGRIHLTYWEKWTGFEFEARQKVVDRFNQSQDRIHVDLLSISQIDRKLMVAIAGGNPPDIAGLFSEFVPVLASQNAIYPLDGYLERAGIVGDEFIEVYWKACSYEGHVWALPTCGNALALCYNKAHFREEGLDPDKPPRTIDELIALEDRLNRTQPDRILRATFLPNEPDWWPYCWPIFFGGKYWDGEGKITIASPEVVEAYEWVAGYSERLGVEKVQAFKGGFGKLFASPQNPFLAGKVSSTFQGEWMHNFVEKYNPRLDLGVTPMPTKTLDLWGTTLAESDIIFIPSGVKHPDESFEFMKYITNQDSSEAFTMEMRAISPRRQRSRNYLENHPNPHIDLFEELVRGGKARFSPQIPMWYEMQDDMRAVFDKSWLHQATPREALEVAEKRLQARLEQDIERWERVAPIRRAHWAEIVERTRQGMPPL
jgi:ABC-type glycerol-3-phosphate transport system substrate-binding protein